VSMPSFRYVKACQKMHGRTSLHSSQRC
jgi:hypothetical protein